LRIYTSMCNVVYAMGRTNIDIDDRLIETVMRIHGCKTKREAVDFALRQLVGDPMTREEMLAMQGSGWEGEVDAVKSSYEPWTDID
jgi:Arc/MetJ family transcription regulator